MASLPGLPSLPALGSTADAVNSAASAVQNAASSAISSAASAAVSSIFTSKNLMIIIGLILVIAGLFSIRSVRETTISAVKTGTQAAAVAA
jgi:hypothetical protein